MVELKKYKSFGVGGSRQPSEFAAAAAREVIALLPSVSVASDCSGVSAMAAQAHPSARVFSVADYRAQAGRGAIVARNVAMISALAQMPNPCWVCIPSKPCPSGLRPTARASQAWNGSGSGSWAEIAYALGLGIPCLVWVEEYSHLPRWCNQIALGGGWHIFDVDIYWALGLTVQTSMFDPL
jgi:hypothetical protein